MNALLSILNAVGDPSRLRLLSVLQRAELTVSELTEIVGQSQPRVSRHLKVLCEAGLLERFKEGSWVFYRIAESGRPADFLKAVLSLDFEDDVLAADRHRFDAVRRNHAAKAAQFFKANAQDWERIRSLHAPEKDVETAIFRAVGAGPVGAFLDAGTGTGRILELCAPHIKRGIGIDVSPEMLAIARDRLERIGATHCQVRLADIYRMPFRTATQETGFDTALFHQVLHYLDDPQQAVAEVARVLRPGGRLIIGDFAQHDLEFLRTELAHRRLGFSDREVESWFAAAHLNLVATEAIAPAEGRPSAGNGKLTVKIWLATRTAAAVQVAA